MKKLLLLTITLALAVMCLIAGRGTAYADVLDGDSNTVLLAPSSVCSDGDVLAVADNVDGGTILHLFSSDGLKSLNVSGETQKIRISGGKIYLLQKNKIIVCTPDDGQCKDFVVQEGVYDFDVDGECLYFWFRTGDMDRVHFKKLDDINSLAVEVCTYNNALHNMQLRLICAAPGGGINLFYTSNGNNCRALYEINGTNAQLKNDEQIGYNLPDFLGAVPCLDTVMLFDSNAVYALDARFDGLETEETAADLCFVKGDAADSGTIYLLTDQRLVLRFKLGFSTESGAYYIEKDMSVEIGTTENNAPLPVFSIENYVTATVEGYPSNIIYTAQALENENLMLSGMLDKTDEIVILNYDGDGDYYYIFDTDENGKGKFGWIKKSERVKSVDKRELNETASVLPFSAFVYPFPCAADGEAVFESKASLKRADNVALLNDFDDDWYFVSCEKEGETIYGFMLKTSLGLSRAPQEYVSYTRYSANPKAGKTLAVYSDESLTAALTDEQGNELRLRANQEVRVYELTDTAAKVCVEIDGTYYRGYVSSEGLMPYRGRMTNAQALGLALLIMVVLATALIVVLRIRKKRELKKQEENERL